MSEPIDLHEAAERLPEGAPQSRVARVLTTISFLVGSAGLLIAMGGDALAVVGRHTGVPFLGSIEIVQAAIVMAAASAMVAATLSRSHATVHIIIERLSPMQRDRFERFADLLSAVFFAVLAAGAVWISAELWDAAETTELLGIPLKPLRLVWAFSASLIVVLYLVSTFRRSNGK